MSLSISIYYYRSSFTFGTPTIFMDVISVFEKLPPESQTNDLKYAITGGAPCSPDWMNKFKKVFPRAKLMVLIYYISFAISV